MKLFIKKAAPKKTSFTAMNESMLKHVTGGSKREAQSDDGEID